MSRAGTRALAVLGSTAAAVAGWVVIGPIAGADLVVEGNNGRTITVGVGAVIFLSVLAGLVAWALLALLERFTSRARPIWVALAAVGLLLSFAPLTGSEASTGTRVGLGLLHVLVAAILVPVMWRSGAPRARQLTGPTTGPRAYDARDEPEKAS
ncbi:DUF6069 family protein [Cryptosporangium arvum]|uniref:DUF6069 family protein n=1 Tax=Cryptosporangium arvum TaxID=80871 RepID=UPI0004BA5861|nr:DUF6069 family protein [Cryptosporangium arvum]